MVKKYFFSVLLIFVINIVFSQSIDRSKKDLGSGSNKSNKSSSSRSINIQNYDPDFIITVLRIFGYASYGILIGDYGNENDLYNNLNSHPYSENGDGNYSETDTISKTNFRIDLENKFISSGSIINGNHLDLKIRPSKYFYLSSDWYQLYEYNTFTKKNDALSLYYFNLAYDRIRGENFNLGWTIGASYVGNEIKLGGFSSGVNAEVFFSNVSLSADAKWSSINQNPVNTYEFKLKYFKKNYFATIGYEHLKIGTPVYNLIGIGAGIYF
jgi:hypothetical protein